jgi:Protein of unknown function (DUF732)
VTSPHEQRPTARAPGRRGVHPLVVIGISLGVVLLLCIGVAVVGALFGDPEQPAAPTAATTPAATPTTAVAPTTPAPTTVPTSAAAPPPAAPTPTGTPDVPAYLAALRVIDPGLVTNEDRAVRRGRDVCLDISQGKPEETVINNARLRFDGGDAAVGPEKARMIVDAVRRHLCP